MSRMDHVNKKNDEIIEYIKISAGKSEMCIRELEEELKRCYKKISELENELEAKK